MQSSFALRIDKPHNKILVVNPALVRRAATSWAEAYVGSYAMGPTKLILPGVDSAAPSGPVLMGAHELLEQLYEETERLLRDKEPAVHYLARVLIERGELILTGSKGSATARLIQDRDGAWRGRWAIFECMPVTLRRCGDEDERGRPK